MVQKRDVVIRNAVVRTVDAHDTIANAVLMRDGRFVVTGDEAQVLAAAHPDAEVIDVDSRAVVPGFLDPHQHPSIAAFIPDSADCSTPPLTTLDEVLEAIGRHCETLVPGRWVRGTGFYPGYIREKRLPNRYELDEVSPNNPFFLVSANAHGCSANSLALSAAGVDEHAPQPWAGDVEIDRNGVPNGILWEGATNLLHSASWNAYATRDWDRAVDLLERVFRSCLEKGITGIGDAMVTPTASELYRRADAEGRLPFAVRQIHGGDHWYGMQDLRRGDLVERVLDSQTDRLGGGAIKVYMDRIFPDGAAVDELHDGCVHHRGTPFYSRAEVHDLAVRANELNIDMAIHAMGNCAVDGVLDAYEHVRRHGQSEQLLRIEHAFIAEQRQAERMARLDVDLVAHPGLAYRWRSLFEDWRGKDQDHLRVIPMRSMIDAGVRVSLASDYPADTFDPAFIMYVAVTRSTVDGGTLMPEEAITAAEALRCYTINAAHALGRGDLEGSIEAGKRANVLVLDRDFVAGADDDIINMQVDVTFVEGELVYERDAAARTA
jgi:predicted amidohydrolase YtcJ